MEAAIALTVPVRILEEHQLYTPIQIQEEDKEDLSRTLSTKLKDDFYLMNIIYRSVFKLFKN